MPKIDADKIKHNIERRTALLALLEEKCHNDKMLDLVMKWENKREKAILFGQLRDMELIPVKVTATITHPELGEGIEDVVNWVVPLDEHADFLEAEKQAAVVEKAKAKMPKDPQGMRTKAEGGVVAKHRAYTGSLLKLSADEANEALSLRVVIAQANLRLAEIKRDSVSDKLIEVLELKDRAELNNIADLNALVA